MARLADYFVVVAFAPGKRGEFLRGSRPSPDPVLTAAARRVSPLGRARAAAAAAANVQQPCLPRPSAG